MLDWLGNAFMNQHHTFDFPVTCFCVKSYSRDAWTTLIMDGVQSGYRELKRLQIFEDMELRRCACGSTMAAPVRLLNQ